MTRRPPRRRFRWGRFLFIGALLAAAVLAVMYLQCGSGFGFGKGAGKGEGEGRARPALATVVDAGVPRCQLRLDGSGLALEGKPAPLEVAVKACRKAGAADVVVTGDARQGAWDELQVALDGAGVQSFVRGNPPAAVAP